MRDKIYLLKRLERQRVGLRVESLSKGRTLLAISTGNDNAVIARMGERKPNLFLIGAMKCGTNYLRKLLNAHPAIFMYEPGELSYFVEPRQLRAIWEDMWKRSFWQSEQHYLELFGSAKDALLYIMRALIERTLSRYWHMVRYQAERRPIVKAVTQDGRYVAVSYYAMQLIPYFEQFGRDRIAILSHERPTQSRSASLQRRCTILGLCTPRVQLAKLSAP